MIEDVFIPDPIEIMDAKIERMIDEFDEKHCMNCGKETNSFFPAYNSPDAPAVCSDCAGITLDGELTELGKKMFKENK